jgi:Cache domain
MVGLMSLDPSAARRAAHDLARISWPSSDGVICGSDGKSEFDRMRACFSRHGAPDAFLYAFDVLEHGDAYLFAYNMKANVLLNPAFPEREGTNVTGQKDKKGKLFHQEIIDTAEIKGSGWVDYWFPKPGQSAPSHKWTYVKRVTIDGVPGLIGSGFFPD